MFAQLLGNTSRGKCDHYLFAGIATPHFLYRSSQVTVARDKDCRVELIVLGIAEKFYRDVDVGHLLLFDSGGCSTLGTFFCAARIFTVMNVYIGKRSEGVKKCVLAGHLLRIFRFRQDSGGKVADRHEPLVWEQQVFAQTTEIEPVIALPHFGLEAVVKVESVNVHRHAHTSGSHERLTIWYAKCII